MDPTSSSREQPMSKPPPSNPVQPQSQQSPHFPLHQSSYAYPTSAAYPSFPPTSSSSASYHTSHTLLAQSHSLPSASVQKLSPTVQTTTRQSSSASRPKSQPQPVTLPPNPTRQMPASRHLNHITHHSFSHSFASSALAAPPSSASLHAYASPSALLSRTVSPAQPQPALSKPNPTHDPSAAAHQQSPILNRQAAAVQQPSHQTLFRNDNFFSTLPQRQKNVASQQPHQSSSQHLLHAPTRQHSSHNSDIKQTPRNSAFPSDRLSPNTDPFPKTKSLPFPISHHPLPSSPAGPSPSNARPPNSGPCSVALPVLSQPSALPSTSPAPSNVAQSHPGTQGVLYDISKLHAAQCTIIAGKVYNDKGHSICGVLNQHDKPCKRIGKCPFHGVSQPVSAQNSCHGYVDESGTAPAPNSDDNNSHGTGSGSGDLAGNGVSASSNLDTGPKGIPKKQQYKHGWSKEEHYLFLRGLQMHDRGSWKQISNVVQSRNATQVQSHAQKYFLRQKQNNKNKRSIHDLTMDSPEMQEMDKRYRNGELRNIVPVGPSDALYDPSAANSGAGRVRDDHVASLGTGISGTNQGITAFAQSNSVGHNIMADANLPKFGQSGALSLSRLGQGQPVSATTLGSSVSSGVHIPQLQGSHQGRGPFQGNPSFIQTHDLLGQTATQKKFNNMKPMRPRSDVPQARDTLLAGSRPGFGQDIYQSGMTPMHSGINTMMSGSHGFSPKGEPKTIDPSLLQPSMDRNGETQNDHGQTQQMYSQNGFQGLYGQSNGNNLFHQGQPRAGGENQLSWPYENEGRNKRQREGVQRESINFQNSFTGIPGDGFGHVGNVQVMAGDNNMVTGFDGPGNHHNATLQTALFGGADAVEVGDNPNAYNMNGQPQGGVSINGFAAQGGLQLNGLSVRGQGNVANTFVRN